MTRIRVRIAVLALVLVCTGLVAAPALAAQGQFTTFEAPSELLNGGDGSRIQALGEKDGGKNYWLIAPVPQWRQKMVKALVAALAG